MSWQDVAIVGPLVGAILVAIAILLVDLVVPGRRGPALTVALLGLGLVAVLTALAGRTPGQAFGGAYTVDALTTFLDLLFISIVGLTIVFAPDYLEPRDLPIAEFAAGLLFVLAGVLSLAGLTHLLLLVLCISALVRAVVL